MKTVKLQQGTPEWHDHRAKYRNASEAPAAMNHSPHVKRNELIHMIKTGDKKAFSDYVQRYILDKGHRFEALSRPIAEGIIGDDLAPLVGTEGVYSASFDGLTFSHDIGFEHKTLNNAIRGAFTIDDLPNYYKEQMEHQAMVGGCEKILFLATQWEPCREDDDEEGASYGYAENEQKVMTRYTLVEKKHFWYYPDPELRAAVVAAWDQLDKDIDAYVPQIVEAAHVSTEIPDLPAVVVSGNTFPDKATRESYTKLAKAMLAPTAKIPANRQEAGDLLMRVEKVTENEQTFKALSKQTDVSEAEKDACRKWLIDMQKLFAKGRIDGGKNLESFKQNEKTEMVNAAAKALSEYISDLDAALQRPFMPELPVDFWAAIKGKSNPANMQNDIDAMLAEKKIEADKLADAIRANLTTFELIAAGFDHLFFDDLDALCAKDADSFTALVKMRIADHKEDEAQKKRDEQARADAELAASKAACAGPAQSGVSLASANDESTFPTSAPVVTVGIDLAGKAGYTAAVYEYQGKSSPSNPQQLALEDLFGAIRTMTPDDVEIIRDMARMTADERKQMAHMRDRIIAMRPQAA